jgi:monothiol glutaredoxin
MIQKTGQMLQPCVEVDGKMLVDVSGEEVEAYLLSNDLVTAGSGEDDVPTNAPCAHEIHVELTRAEYEDGVPIHFGQPRL